MDGNGRCDRSRRDHAADVVEPVRLPIVLDDLSSRRPFPRSAHLIVGTASRRTDGTTAEEQLSSR